MSACDSTVQLYMPWSYATQDEERFKRIVKTNLAVFMIFVGYNGAQSYLRRGWTDLRQMYDLHYLSNKFGRLLWPFF